MNPKDIFGSIEPPKELQPFIQKGGEGAGGISLFFNNLISLIYVVGLVIFVAMFLWGALEWLLSGGNKDSVGNAQRRLTHAIVGLVLLALSFAIIRLIGLFTGFTFFTT